MPLRDTSGFGERVPRELIEADFSVAAQFVDMAEEEARGGNDAVATQLLGNATKMLNDIRARLQRLVASQKETFEPRCAELEQRIALVLLPSDAGMEED